MEDEDPPAPSPNGDASIEAVVFENTDVSPLLLESLRYNLSY